MDPIKYGDIEGVMTIALTTDAGAVDLTDKTVNMKLTNSVTWRTHLVEGLVVVDPATGGQVQWTPTLDDWSGMFPGGPPTEEPADPSQRFTLFLVEFPLLQSVTLQRTAPTVNSDTIRVYHPLPDEES